MREGLFDHHRRDSISMLAAGGTPVAQKILGPCPEGYCWYLESVAFSVVGAAHNALFDLAVTPDGGDLPPQASWDHQGLAWTVQTAVIAASMNNTAAVFVPPAHFAHAYASAGSLAAGDVVTVTYQVAVHQLDPAHLFMSPEDRQAVREAHERLAEHQVAESAVAGRRAV